MSERESIEVPMFSSDALPDESSRDGVKLAEDAKSRLARQAAAHTDDYDADRFDSSFDGAKK